MSRTRAVVVTACLAALCMAGHDAAVGAVAITIPQAPSLASTLAAAAGYVDRLGGAADGVVLEEDYVQQAQMQTVTARRVRSDMAILADAQFGWIEFRDPLEVDGKPIADRQIRAAELFAHPSPAALDQARRIVKEGARFNLSPVGLSFARTLNLPMASLQFLRSVNQPRSAFVRDGFEKVGGERTARVTFTEKSKPRLIGSPDEAAASGRFWIVPESGQVCRSELRLESQRGTTVVQALIRVEYTDVPKVGLRLPKSMDEEYRISNAATRQLFGAIQARAVYSNIRKFNVTVHDEMQ
jgi:hypothetical protein